MRRELLLLAGLYLGLLDSHGAVAQQPQFSSEALEFQISDSACALEGIYRFKNSSASDARTRLYYPVPVTELTPLPQDFTVYSLTRAQRIPFSRHTQGISFWLEIAPYGTEEIRISYRQLSRDQQFNYILTSTQKWGKALDSASYVIIIPKTLDLKSCSLEIDTMQVFADHRRYGILRRNFLPLTDLELIWGSYP